MTLVESSSEAWDAGTLRNPHGQPDKAERVRRMFDAIAPTYERVNRVTSAGRDRVWRRRAVALAAVRADDRVLDLACGTGDLAREILSAGPESVVGADFAEQMLQFAAARPCARLTWCRADAHRLPFADGAFSIVTCAFGVRNFQELGRGLSEMRRVLRPGGRAVIIEFGMPRGRLLRSAYQFYFEHVLPRVAGLISRDRTGAYQYLPRSVETFLDRDGMCTALRAAGFSTAEAHSMTLGVTEIYVARAGD